MRRTVEVNKLFSLDIGYVGENNATEVAFDFTSWAEEYGSGSPVLRFKRNLDEEAYPVTLDVEEENLAVWTVSNTDLFYKGQAEGQLQFVVDDVVKKSRIFSVMVSDSLLPTEDAPDPYDDWMDDLIRLTGESETNAYNASMSASDALGYKNDAKGYSDTASEYAANALLYAGQAEGYKNDASGSASDASGYANEAKGYRNQASGYADDANGYKSDASGYANDASGYASDAQGYANDASGYADDASGYANDASGYADEAQGYASDAQGSAEQAQASAEVFDELAKTTLVQKNASGDVVSISDGSEYPVKELLIEFVPTQSGSGDPSPTNYRTITGRTGINVYVSPTSAQADATTYTFSLGSTYYKGVLNATTGVLTVTHAYKLLTDSDVSSVGTASTGVKYATCGNAGSGAKGNSLDIICSSYLPTATAPQTEGYIRVASNNIYIYDNAFTDLDSAKDILEATPVQLVYELSTPVTVQLTAQEITTEEGTNYIWSDSGDVDVTYRVPTQEYIDSMVGSIETLLSEI